MKKYEYDLDLKYEWYLKNTKFTKDKDNVIGMVAHIANRIYHQLLCKIK